MKYRELQELHRMDLHRWGGEKHLKLYCLKPEYKLVYRYRNVKYLSSNKWMKPLYLIERYLYNRCCVKCGCDIPSHSTIGGGFKILHGWGIVINSKSVIGKNFTIVSGTVIGATKTGQPVIGNNVSVGAHALLLGGIVIGDNVDIGAGAIVTHDIPTNGVVYSDASPIRRIKETK